MNPGTLRVVGMGGGAERSVTTDVGSDADSPDSRVMFVVIRTIAVKYTHTRKILFTAGLQANSDEYTKT